jgi:hypothetical protein
MTVNIIAIISGLVAIAGIIFKLYYDKKQKEPYNQKKAILDEYKKRQKEIEGILARGDYANLSSVLDELNSDLRRLCSKKPNKVSK